MRTSDDLGGWVIPPLPMVTSIRLPDEQDRSLFRTSKLLFWCNCRGRSSDDDSARMTQLVSAILPRMDNQEPRTAGFLAPRQSRFLSLKT